MAYKMFILPEKRRGILVAGLSLTIMFSVLIGSLGVGVLYIFGVPFLGLGVGIALIWFSIIRLSSKALLTVAPIPIIIGVFFLSIFLNTAEAETFLIPSNYRGEIVVFYNEPCGEPPKFENGRRIYEFSSDGILITQHSENKGFFNRRFYLASDDKSRKEIGQFGRQDFETEAEEWVKQTPHSTDEKLTKETVGVFWAYGQETYFASRNSIGYLVSDYAAFEQNDQKSKSMGRKRFTENAVELLQKCRERKS